MVRLGLLHLLRGVYISRVLLTSLHSAAVVCILRCGTTVELGQNCFFIHSMQFFSPGLSLLWWRAFIISSWNAITAHAFILAHTNFDLWLAMLSDAILLFIIRSMVDLSTTYLGLEENICSEFLLALLLKEYSDQFVELLSEVATARQEQCQEERSVSLC